MPACYVVFNEEAADWQADVGGVIEAFPTEAEALRWAFDRLKHVTEREYERLRRVIEDALQIAEAEGRDLAMEPWCSLSRAAG